MPSASSTKTPRPRNAATSCLSPFWSADDGSVELAAALAESLTAPDAPRLPAKFGFCNRLRATAGFDQGVGRHPDRALRR